MALKLYWRCEGTTLDGTHDFTAGDNTATLNSIAAINTDAAKLGTNGLDCPSASDYAIFAISSGDLFDRLVGKFGFWLRFEATPDSGSQIFTAQGTLANDFIRILAIGDELRFDFRQDGNSVVSLSTTAANMTTATWYWVEASWDQPNNDRRIAVYDSSGALINAVEDTATAYLAPNDLITLNIGNFGGGGTFNNHYDNVFVADAYAEDLLTFRDITSYTEYGAAPPTVTDVDGDESFASSATDIAFSGTEMGADETERDAYLCQGAVEVLQTQNAGDDTSGEIASVTGFGLGGLLKYGVATTLKVVTGAGEDEISITITPPSGYAYVDLTSIHPVEEERLTAVPDLEIGDQIEYETVGGKVEVLADATFTVDDETVTEFDVRAFDTEWGAVGTQEVVIDDGTAPDAFAFTDQTDVELSTVCTSAPVTIEGIEAANSPITISGGTYSINAGAFTSDAGTVEDGDEVRVRVTSSGSYATGVTATVTIGGVSDGFTATTRAQVAPTITTTTLANGNVASAYSRAIAATGDGPFTWTVTAGVLPDGLALDEDTGVISGTPTTEEDQTFTVEAENAAGTDDQELSISVGAELEGGSEVAIIRRRRRH